MKLELFHYDLPLKHPFTITHETRTVQPSMIVRLGFEHYSGLGEAVATSYYGYAIEDMLATVESKRNEIESFNAFTSPDAFYLKLLEWFPDQSFLRCALDMAAHDLFGHIKGKPLYALWGLNTDSNPISNFTIGMDTIEVMKEKIIEQPWPLYKIKLGTDHDIEIVKQLRTVTDSPFRVDANCAWTAEETIKNSIALKPLNVEFIEQPLPVNKLEQMKEVKRQSVLPIIADENCMVYEDVAKCAGYFSGVNIKLSKCGGLTQALKMLAKADELGLKKMVGCMTESSVGISAIGQLLPLLDYVDMDGALLIAQDPANGVWLDDQGVAHYPERPGTGAQLKDVE